jgi:putative transferase (TIGR04331 family)
VRKTLVTTALEATWPKTGSILFLGTWCCSFARKELWATLNYDVLDYHWDDRSKLMNDYNDLENIYENYLIQMTERLNQIHKTNYSIRFWRILIGPWLYTVVQVLFDRWFMLKKAIKNENSIELYALNTNNIFLISEDMDSFNTAIESDDWNEALYRLLLQEFFGSEISLKFVKKNENKKVNKSIKVNVAKNALIKASNKISSIFSGKNDVFIIGSHLPYFKLFLLQLKLKQFPSFWFRAPISLEYDDSLIYNRENKLSCNFGMMPDFEAVLNNMLMKLIPKAYLEGFRFLSDAVLTKGWPKKPSHIFTSNSYASDDLFKYWAGANVEIGSKLFIGQHGGNFGMTKMATQEIHQKKISYKWLSWGRDDKHNSIIVPVGNFKVSFNKVPYDKNGDALMVLMTLPKYSYYLYSVPIAGQVNSYFNDQLKFVEALPQHIRQKLRIRIYPIDRDWDQKKQFEERFKDLSFDESNRSIKTSLRKSKIFIGTYNATTYLEAFAYNMPSVLFWDHAYWETDDQTEIYFEKLRSIGVLHSSPISAAKHLAKIWNNVDDWWFGPEVQEVIKDFNANYSWHNPNVLNSIKKQLKS